MRVNAGTLFRLAKLYEKWVTEGKPPFSLQYHKKEEKPQFYYDSYHDNIEKESNGVYTFNIQVDDSPNGDTWERGRFKIENNHVTILEHKSYIN